MANYAFLLAKLSVFFPPNYGLTPDLDFFGQFLGLETEKNYLI